MLWRWGNAPHRTSFLATRTPRRDYRGRCGVSSRRACRWSASPSDGVSALRRTERARDAEAVDAVVVGVGDEESAARPDRDVARVLQARLAVTRPDRPPGQVAPGR